MQAHAHLARASQDAADARTAVAAWAASSLASPAVEARRPHPPKPPPPPGTADASSDSSTGADPVSAAECLRLQGNAAFKARDWRAAESLYAASLGAHPTPEAAANAAAAALRLGDHAAALASADRALRLRPGMLKAHVRRAQALAGLGAEDEGFFELDEAARWWCGSEGGVGEALEWGAARGAALAAAAAARGWRLPEEGVDVPVLQELA